jgi:hypothetical protein
MRPAALDGADRVCSSTECSTLRSPTTSRRSLRGLSQASSAVRRLTSLSGGVGDRAGLWRRPSAPAAPGRPAPARPPGRPGAASSPCREGLPGPVGGLGGGQDVPGGLGGDGWVRSCAPSASCSPPSAVPSRGLGRAGRCRRSYPHWRLRRPGLIARGSRPGGLPGVGIPGPTAPDPRGDVGLLVRNQGLSDGGHADPSVADDHRDGRAAGFARRGGQDGHRGAVARRRGKRAREPGSSRCRALRAASGRGCWCVPLSRLRSLFSGAIPVLFAWADAPVRQLLWSGREVKRFRDMAAASRSQVALLLLPPCSRTAAGPAGSPLSRRLTVAPATGTARVLTGRLVVAIIAAQVRIESRRARRASTMARGAVAGDPAW